MSDREASLQELLVASFQSQMNNQYTAIPCIVVAVRDSLEGMLVDIQPTINQKMKDGTTKERPVILGVPVSFPVSDSSGMTFPVNAGVTTGTAIFSMRNMDAWKSGNGKPSTPMNFAKMDKGDAIFYPGIQPPGMSVNNPAKHIWPHNTNDTVVFHNLGKNTETEIRLLQAGGVVINTNQDAIVNCLNAEIVAEANITMSCQVFDLTATTATFDIGNTTWLGNISQTGNYTQLGNYAATGAATFNGILFSTHDHIPGPGPSNP